jgi:MoaA/NifB/PqqE/SkfB family radical SAM enzyme
MASRPQTLSPERDINSASSWQRKLRSAMERGNTAQGLVCSEIFESMGILANGDAVCGCADVFTKSPLGNVHDEPLGVIFDRALYRELRRRMIADDLPEKCVGCPSRLRPRSGREAVGAGRLRWIQIEPIFNCNLRCPHCALTEMRDAKWFARAQKEMHFETFTRIIDQTPPDLRQIRFHMLGEPMLHRRADDMLAYAKSKRPDVFISIETNGHHVTPEIQRLLVDIGVDYIKFSIDGARQETYETYRVAGDFRLAYDNMAGLIRTRDAAGRRRPRVLWQCILFEWNDSDEEIRLTQRLAREANVDELYWLLTHSPGASRRFPPGQRHPILEGEGQSLHETLELAAMRGEARRRAPATPEEYDPWQ